MSRIYESVALHYTDGGSSDKVYNIHLEEIAPGQYTVTGYNGKRGSTLVPRKQTDSPVSYPEAKRIFDNLEREKRNHRKTPYRVIERNGTAEASQPPTNSTASASTGYDSTGYVAIHPKKITESEAIKLFDNDDYFAEQKCDGVFLSILFQGGRVTASNKLGNGIQVPPKIAAAMRLLASISGCEISLGLAGEYLNSTFHVFTVWEKNGASLLSLPQRLRVALKNRLDALLTAHNTSAPSPATASIKFVYTAETKTEKLALYETIKNKDGEGIVFKHCESDLSFKYKLYETTEVLLIANAKRSAECFAYHNGALISLGSTTLPNDAAHKQVKEANLRQEPIVGSIKYLYLSAAPSPGPERGQLTQSSFLRFRPEYEPTSCTTIELKVANKTVHETSSNSTAVETPIEPTRLETDQQPPPSESKKTPKSRRTSTQPRNIHTSPSAQSPPISSPTPDHPLTQPATLFLL